MKGVRSQFSLRTISKEAKNKNKLKIKVENTKNNRNSRGTDLNIPETVTESDSPMSSPQNINKNSDPFNNIDEFGLQMLRDVDVTIEESVKELEKEDCDDIDFSGLEKFFVKPASEFIVDFFDAFSNIDDGGVALMMEYMDGE